MNHSRTRIFNQVVLGTFVLSFVLALVGCNTTEGLGKDIKSAGAGIEESADKHKPD